MKIKIIVLLGTLTSLFLAGCSDNDPVNPDTKYEQSIEVILKDIPYKTDQFLRIPYTLKMWEYEKENLVLEQIKILDKDNNNILFIIEKDEMPLIYKDPLEDIPFFENDKLDNYYLSIQLPILLESTKPATITHKFEFKNTKNSSIKIIEGGTFSPDYSNSPMVIGSPVKGERWLFINQSNLGYHFNVVLFTDGKLYTSERFAFDNVQLGEDYENVFEGDITDNHSYFAYLDTLYAVADGTIITVKDGRPENNGNLQDVQINSLDEFSGNYLILDLGNSRFAEYAHCAPNSFFVSPGDQVKKGDPVALIGNSGNSTVPHLHFQIADNQDPFFSKGVPFVIEKYSKLGDIEQGLTSPKTFINSMMEETTLVSLK